VEVAHDDLVDGGEIHVIDVAGDGQQLSERLGAVGSVEIPDKTDAERTALIIRGFLVGVGAGLDEEAYHVDVAASDG